jgi:hypothetical protein
MRGIFAAGLCACLTGLAAAPALADRNWSHKDWNAWQRGARCGIWTGGDGAGSLEISFERGGYRAVADYAPLWYRSEPMPLEMSDFIVIYFDGLESWIGEDISVFDGEDKWGDYFRAAFMPDATVPAFIDMLRQADTLDFARQRGDEEPLIIDQFSLAGFTVALMKTAEWCKFNPKLMPSS